MLDAIPDVESDPKTCQSCLHTLSPEVLRSADTSRASLYMRQVEMSDTGNYTCISDNQASTVLLVVTGESSVDPVKNKIYRTIQKRTPA